MPKLKMARPLSGLIPDTGIQLKIDVLSAVSLRHYNDKQKPAES